MGEQVPHKLLDLWREEGGGLGLFEIRNLLEGFYFGNRLFLRYLGRVLGFKVDQVWVDDWVEELFINSEIAKDLVGVVIYVRPGGDYLRAVRGLAVVLNRELLVIHVRLPVWLQVWDEILVRFAINILFRAEFEGVWLADGLSGWIDLLIVKPVVGILQDKCDIASGEQSGWAGLRVAEYFAIKALTHPVDIRPQVLSLPHDHVVGTSEQGPADQALLIRVWAGH